MKTNFFLLAGLVLTMSATGCGERGIFCHRPEGPNVTQTLILDDLTGFELQIAADITLRQGETQTITVTGAQNHIDLLKTDVNNGIWKIKYTECTRGANDLHIDITVPDITYLAISGSGDVETDGRFTLQSNVKVEISGSGDLELEVEASRLESKITGSGNMTLAGSAPDADHTITGSGKIEAFGLATDNTDAEISGSGNMKIAVAKNLNATISGSGDIYYTGNPAVTTRISGSGNVIHQ